MDSHELAVRQIHAGADTLGNALQIKTEHTIVFVESCSVEGHALETLRQPECFQCPLEELRVPVAIEHAEPAVADCYVRLDLVFARLMVRAIEVGNILNRSRSASGECGVYIDGSGECPVDLDIKVT